MLESPEFSPLWEGEKEEMSSMVLNHGWSVCSSGGREHSPLLLRAFSLN